MGREMNVPGFHGLGGRWSLPLDLAVWDQLGREDDDAFHQPDQADYTRYKPGWSRTLRDVFSPRGLGNLGCVAVLVLLLVLLFGGWPILQSQLDDYRSKHDVHSGYNTGGINATGQVPATIGQFGLIDPQTPRSALKHVSLETGAEWDLVFSDEFNTDGRSFYPGDDPYWEAADLHYWVTNNLEWYDPRSITTRDGHMIITLSNEHSHNLNYTGGMVSTWNKFCYTGGYFETKLSLPGTSDVYGLWPAVWTLGNLGRAGYGGTLEGMWPYTYAECDLGTLKNQSLNGKFLARRRPDRVALD
jgi:hypothetical protein